MTLEDVERIASLSVRSCNISLHFVGRLEESARLFNLAHRVLINLVKQVTLVHVVYFYVCGVYFNAACLRHGLLVERYVS